jgi:hypothetical protein
MKKGFEMASINQTDALLTSENDGQGENAVLN